MARVKGRRVAVLASLTLLLGWLAVSPSAAQTSPGDVAQIGGQGPTADCHDESPTNLTKRGDDGTAPLGSARFEFNSLPNVHSIAVDAGRRNVLVPDRGVVRGLYGPVAGVARGDPLPSTSTSLGTPRGLTGAAAEGADPRAVALQPVAVAVDADATNLYILERNALRQVNLKGTPTIHTLVGPAVGTSLTAGESSTLAADKFGHVFIADSTLGNLHRLDPGSNSPVLLTTLARNGSITVDAGGTAVYGVTGGQNGNDYTVSRINPVSGSMSVVAGGGAATADAVPATSASFTKPPALAVDPLGGHLYLADKATGRIRMVDLGTGIINTVVGSGQSGYQAAGKAASFTMNTVTALAVDLFGNVYMLVGNDCALFMAVTPVPIFTPPPPSNPPPPQPPPSTPAGPTGQDSTSTGSQSAPQTAGTPNQAGAPQQGAAPTNQTHIVSSDNGAGATQPQNELRIVDQGNAVTAPQQAAQPTPQAVQTANPAAQTSAPLQVNPAPTPAVTPATDSGTVTLAPDPGAPAAGVVADAAPAVPAAPAVAPVPPAPASAPPPAAPQPISTPGLVHGDSAAPVRGATRYAMVRNDDEQAVGALAMAGAAAMVAIFLCVMVVAPGASSKPKPRPKGAY